MYSTHNEEKFFVAERFIRSLEKKIYKYMTLISKYVYIDRLDDIIKEYNDAYYRTIKIKLIDVKNKTYIDFSKEANDKNPIM